jgi:hypothetical protein
MRNLLHIIRKLWHAEEDLHMKRIAQRYAERAWMDGVTIRRTGEVVPRESV